MLNSYNIGSLTQRLRRGKEVYSARVRPRSGVVEVEQEQQGLEPRLRLHHRAWGVGELVHSIRQLVWCWLGGWLGVSKRCELGVSKV